MDGRTPRTSRHPHGHDVAARHAGRRRDESLGRITRVTRRVTVGALALAAILGIYVSRALPGHAATPATGSSSPTTTPGTGSTPATDPATEAPVQPTPATEAPVQQTPATVAPPVTVPAPTQAPARVRTGGS